MDTSQFYHAYLGTNSMRGSKGIYHLTIHKDTLEFDLPHNCQALNADYLCLSPDQRTLYAVYEVIYYDGKPSSAAGAYRIDNEGGITPLNTRHVHGQMACFCSTDRKGTKFLSSSYMSGSVTVTPIEADGSLGGDQSVIQQPVRRGFHWPSVHSAYFLGENDLVFSTNVGLDRVFLHRETPSGWEPLFELQVDGRPRQAAFSPDGQFVYVSTESGGEVFVLACNLDGDAPLQVIQRIHTTRPGWQGHAETAGIKLSPDGTILVVSNRAPEWNNLAVFVRDPSSGTLSFTGHVPVSGVFPRDFDFTPDGRYLLVGLQFSDSLELFEVDYRVSALRSVVAGFHLPCCSGIKFLRRDG